MIIHAQIERMERRRLEKGQVDDLVLLDDVSEDAVLSNLRTTSKANRIYTWIGPVLVSVNPFHNIAGLYAPDLLRKYRGRHTWELAPHVYAVAEDTYSALMSTHVNQCILITGESGAGKTEAAKKVMEYVAAVSPLISASDVDAKDRLLQSNPVLEAFGNAKTIRNNNSSRFGKYMELIFDFSGRPVGGRIRNFLLEKPRVVSPAAGERSFHVFYLLLAGATPAEKQEMKLGAPSSYAALQQTGCLSVQGMSDKDEYIQMRGAMSQVGFPQDQQAAYMRLVAAILSLPNIAFEQRSLGGTNKPQKAASFSAGSGEGKQALLATAALLEVDPAALEAALTHRTITGGKDTVTSPLTTAEACVETARAFGMALYARMFTSVVALINDVIAPGKGLSLTMGVLDIYGFEIFEVNSFEQLCINYCNEKLQQFFIELTMRSEQDEYAAEGIEWVPIDFFNNLKVCELIEGKRPAGILEYLNEESLIPKGTDASLFTKLQAQLKHEHFRTPDAKTRALAIGGTGGLFTIVHYAGEVHYSPVGLLDKNKDTLFRDLLLCGGASRSALVSSLFPEAREKAAASKRPLTAATQFRSSMSELVATLSQCAPHYIRTIKPNDEKRAGVFDPDRVRSQVKYLGLVENVRVRRAGFAFRQTFEHFGARFRVLSPQCWPTYKSAIEAGSKEEVATILRHCGIDNSAYQMGKTKVFIRAPITLFALEELRKRRLADVARILQAAWRSYKARKYFMELREKAQGIFMGKKRRRGSWSLYFMGDYINASESAALTRLLTKHGESRILFADVVSKVSRLRKVQERALVLTEGSLYTCTMGKQGALGKETNRVPLDAISGVSLSTFADGYMVIHVRPGTRNVPADLVVSSVRKAEILTSLSSEMEIRRAPLTINFSDTIKYRSKKGGIEIKGVVSVGTEERRLHFREDASIDPKAAVALLDEMPPVTPADKLRLSVKVSPLMGSLAPIQLETRRHSHADPKGGAKKGGSLLSRMRGASREDLHAKPTKVAWAGGSSPAASAGKRALKSQDSRGLASGGGSGGGAYGAAAAGGGGGSAGAGYSPNYAPSSGTPRKPPAPPAPPRPMGRQQSFSSFPKAQAKWEYKASKVDELSFKVGAVLRVIEKTGAWWTCADESGKTGQVPSNYVQQLL